RSKKRERKRERVRVEVRHGVRWCVRARTGADGPLLCCSVQVFESVVRSDDSLRHARGSGLGFCFRKSSVLCNSSSSGSAARREDSQIVISAVFDPGCRGLHSSYIADKVHGLWRLL
ncbi:unnamed protein product, partial [Brassica rapa]